MTVTDVTPRERTQAPFDRVAGAGLSTQVRAMRALFDLPVNFEPTVLDAPTLRLHYKIIGEEFVELTEAIFGAQAAARVKKAVLGALVDLTAAHDFIATVDALGDLAITVHGMAAEMGVPFSDVTDEQMRANFSKVDDDGRPVFNADGKFIKEGTNYVAPNIPLVLGVPADFGKAPTRVAAQTETLDRDAL